MTLGVDRRPESERPRVPGSTRGRGRRQGLVAGSASRLLASGALGGLLVAPGVGVDVDDMAVLGEAVDEGCDAGSTGEDGAPLLVGEVGADDGGALLVAATDEVVEQVG